ncbi:MAG: aspartyl/asparaginyl beta-hydroxylase domain-containing protein [Proteobacteria bacterium]|nr:aspartyl/asparaginyl beta-hydroxylase domain-containing protein [Pseudomonadota bacterium]
MDQSPLGEAEARALADAIEQVSRVESPELASKLVNQALQRGPRQPLVLNAAAGYMMRAGRPRDARELFERASAIDAGSKVLWLNLANACRALGDAESETAALDRALAIEPRYVVALLQKGQLAEQRGQSRAAVTLYEAALDSMASGAPAPQQAARAIDHARDVVAASRRELEGLLEQEAATVRERHAGADLSRYQACRDLYLRKRPVYYSQPKQVLFPYLPALEFFGREYFPWLGTLEAATDEIAAEARGVLASDGVGFKPYVDFPPGAPIDQWAPLNHSMDWSVYPLWHDGTPIAAHLTKCPRTAAVLAQLPLCEIPGYAPGAFFSVLKPRTRLPPHTGTTNTRSIVHLPLVVPDGCTFRVGTAVRTWQKGQAWVFDDTIEHEAHNDSDQLRIILIFDIWNPLLTAAERDLVSALTVGIGRHYGEDAPVLGSR